MRNFLLTVLFTSAMITFSNAEAEDFSKWQPLDNKVQDELKWNNELLARGLSDYSLYALMALPIIDVLDESRAGQKVGAIALAHGINAGITHVVKVNSARMRPSGDNPMSFWSGHASSAFVGAAVTCHFQSSEKCAVSLAAASATGYLRIAGNKHWFSDVIAGAAAGFLIGSATPFVVMSW